MIQQGGDRRNAGLLVRLCKDWDLEKCIAAANAVGPLAVVKLGAITAMPDKRRLAEFRQRMGAGVQI